MRYGSIDPGTTLAAKHTVFLDPLPKTKAQLNGNRTLMKKCSEEAIGNMDCDYYVYPDGGAKIKELKSGAGFVVTNRAGEILHSEALPAGMLTSAQGAEVMSAAAALAWFRKEKLPPGKLGVCWDCQTGIMALDRGPLRQTTLAGQGAWKSLLGLGRGGWKIFFQHIFGHCGIRANHLAHLEAEKGKDMVQYGVPVEYTDWENVIDNRKEEEWRMELHYSLKHSGTERSKHYGPANSPASDDRETWAELVRMVGVKTRRVEWFGEMLRRHDRKVMRQCRLCGTNSGETYNDRETKDSSHRERRKCSCDEEGHEDGYLYSAAEWEEHLGDGEEHEEYVYDCVCGAAFLRWIERANHIGTSNRQQTGDVVHKRGELCSHAERDLVMKGSFCYCGVRLPNKAQLKEHMDRTEGTHHEVAAEEGIATIRDISLTRHHRDAGEGEMETFEHLSRCAKLKDNTAWGKMEEGEYRGRAFNELCLVSQALLVQAFKSTLEAKTGEKIAWDANHWSH